VNTRINEGFLVAVEQSNAQRLATGTGRNQFINFYEKSFFEIQYVGRRENDFGRHFGKIINTLYLLHYKSEKRFDKHDQRVLF
jgi:hypothetical protein